MSGEAGWGELLGSGKSGDCGRGRVARKHDCICCKRSQSPGVDSREEKTRGTGLAWKCCGAETDVESGGLVLRSMSF